MPFDDFDDTSSNGENVTIVDGVDGSIQAGVTADKRLKVDSAFTGAAQDAFSRLRVSTPTTIFDAYFVENSKPLRIDQSVTGSATITRNTNSKSMELVTTTASGDDAILQTKEYFHYIPGQSVLAQFTGVLSPSQTNLVQRLGYFDTDNGLYFQMSGSTFSIARRSKVSGSVVETIVNQASWDDPLDGTGASGETLDLTKAQIFFIDFLWLGSGITRYGFNINGKPVIVHTLYSANIDTDKYMATGSLPLRFQITNTGTISSPSKLRIHCISLTIEGEQDSSVVERSVDTGATTRAISTSSLLPLISLRLKSANVRAQLVPKAISVLATSNDDILVRVYLNPTLTGASWVSAGTNAISEYDVSATSFTGGEIIRTTYLAKNGADIADFSTAFLKLVADIAGTRDILTIAVQSLTSSATGVGSITYEEVF